MLSVTFDTQPAEIYAIKIHSEERVEFAVIVPKCDPGRKEVNLYSRNIDILMKKELFFCVVLPEDTEKPEQSYTTDAATKQVPHTDQQRMPTSGSSQVPVLNQFTLADGVLYMKKVSSASENLSKFFSHVECALQETTNIEDAIAVAGDAMFDVRDSLGRSVGTCLASHPKCPEVLLRVLFQDCKYDPYEPDCYGLTCIDWMAHNNMEHRIGLIVPEEEDTTSEIDEDTSTMVKDKLKLTKANMDPAITDTQKLIEQFKKNRVYKRRKDEKRPGLDEEQKDPSELRLKILIEKSNSGDKIVTSVLVGKQKLKWTEKSKCVPGHCDESNEILALDLAIVQGKQVMRTMQSAANVVAEYNANKEFDVDSCNHQHFVDDMCSAIGVKLQYSASVTKVLDEIRESGYSQPFFYVDRELSKKLKIETGKVIFTSHEELDDFVATHLDLLSSDDKHLLKGYDRAYWLKRDPDDVNASSFEPRFEGCPFGNPEKSNSSNIPFVQNAPIVSDATTQSRCLVM
jgi:hypothetical protein